MQALTRIPPYSSPDRLTIRQIATPILLALLLHVVVMLAFYIQPSNTAPSPKQTLDISFEVSQPNSPAQPDKPPIPQQTPPPPEELPAATTTPPPAPPVPEAPPQTTPAAPPPETPAAAPQNTQPPAEEAQPLFRLTRLPGFKRKLDAVYPSSERRAGIQAYVLTEVTIDSQGNVTNVHIVTSAGSAFDNAVIEALKKSVFSPGYIGDKAVPVRFQIPYRFSLN